MQCFLETHKEMLPDHDDLVRLMSQAERLRLTMPKSVGEHFQNDTRSLFTGQGMEFSRVREYMQGDDIRSMDWRVTARTGKPHVKIYREERQRVLILAFDLSKTLLFGTSRTTKLAQGMRAAALLAFSMQGHRDRAGALFFGEMGAAYMPASTSRDLIWRIRKYVLDASAPVKHIMRWAQRLNQMPPGRTVAFISDFLNWTAADWQHIRAVAQRHEILAVQLFDPRECTMPDMGLLRVAAADTTNSTLIDTRNKRGREAYAARWQMHQTQLVRQLSGIQARHWSLSTDEDVLESLRAQPSLHDV